jgi:aryl-alcohol dehydrogenase-like predicted oxidoreductase
VHQRAIGDTEVTLVGVGDVSLARADARGLSPLDVERTLHDALEHGITLVDAFEDAEQLAGASIRALRLRDRVILATHVPALAEQEGRPRRDVLPERLPAGYVQTRIEASLRHTKLDALPLAFLPLRATWLTSPAYPELAGTCARLIREGKVMRFGVRLELPSDDHEAELEPFTTLAEPFSVLTATFNACDRRALPLLSLKLPFLARNPLAGAALAGTIGPGVKLSPRDDRHSLSTRDLEQIAVGVAKLAALVRDKPPAAFSCDAAAQIIDQAKPPTHYEATTLPELALRFAIDRGAFVLPRLHRREHLPTAFAVAVAQPLSTGIHAAIERALP